LEQSSLKTLSHQPARHNWLIIVLSLLVISLGVSGLLGHVLGIQWLGTFSSKHDSDYLMSIPIAIGLIFLGFSLGATFINQPQGKGRQWFASLSTLVIGGIGFYFVGRYLLQSGLNPIRPFIQNFPGLHVPFLPALNLLLLSLALMAFPYLHQGYRAVVYFVDIPALLILGASTFVLAGHVLNEPILFNFGMVMPSALAFIASSMAILTGTLPFNGLMSPLYYSSIRGRVMAYGAILASLGVILLGLTSIYQVNYNITAALLGLEIADAKSFYAALEIGTILLALLVLIVSLRAIHYYSETLLLARQEKQGREREMVLRKTVQALHSSLTLDDTFEQIVTALGKQLQSDRCFIAKYNKKSGKLSPPTREYRSSEAISTMTSPSPQLWEAINEYSLALCADSDQQFPIDFNCYSTGLSRNSQACLRDMNIQSGLVSAITYRGSCLAMLFIHQVSRKRKWNRSERALVQEIADQAAIAIYQAELYQQLQESNRDLEHFASIASHDLKAPLRKAQIFLSQVLEEKTQLQPENQDALLRAQKSIQQMQSLISDLLSLARVSKSQPHFKPVQLSKVLDTVVNTLEPVINEKQAIIETGPMETVMGDSGQLEQLLQNLIENGLKYQPEGQTPVLRVQAACIENRYCQITVQDNGIGFRQEQAEKIFEPFARLHGKGSSYAGTGVGLAICKRIAERHGGTISAKSAPGLGTSFTVQLPT
jgi:signal transduction histidine kinase